MTFYRRQVLATLTACGLALMAGPSFAQDKPYPSETIHLITGFPAGSGSDVLVRYLGKELADLTHTTVVVENKTGAAGNIGSEYVARAKPDGYTVYIHAASSIAANMHLFKTPPIDVVKDLKVAATINQQAFMLIVPKDSPYQTVKELVAGLEEKGDQGNYAISNTTGRVMGRLLAEATGLTTEEISYQTDLEIVNDMKSSTIDFAMMNPVFSLAQVRAGNARVLAVSTPERIKAAPEYPTFGEAGYPSLVMLSWFAALVPSATPEPIIEKLNVYFNEILVRPETEKFLNENGGDAFISTPKEGQDLLVQQVEDWRGYVAAAGIEPE